MHKNFVNIVSIDPTAIVAAARLWSAEQRKMAIFRKWLRGRGACRAGLRIVSKAKSPSYALASMIGKQDGTDWICGSYWVAAEMESDNAENGIYTDVVPLQVQHDIREENRRDHNALMRTPEWHALFAEVNP